MPSIKVLTIGIQFGEEAFDEYDFGDAPTLSNYHAVIVSISAVSTFIKDVTRGEDYRDSSGRRIVNKSHRDVPEELSLLQLVERRAEEALNLVANGGLIVIIVHPNVYHTLEGRGAWWVYDWIPSVRSDSYHPSRLVMGDGPVGQIDSPNHPFTSYLRAMHSRSRFAAYLKKDSGIPERIIPIAKTPAGH
ncbi:MAG: hypothetical protein HYX93_02805, partial [Chloroflexi bacterium]|nr:hypothetical protein [Chloroflexota bacterium]